MKIFDYYHGTLRMALADDLNNPDPRNIYNHIQTCGEDKLPEIRIVGEDKFEAAARAFVEKLQLWINEITPEGVLDDMDRVLEEHDGTSNHWQPISLGSKEQRLTCHYDSKCMQMTGHPQNIEGVPLHLWLSRMPVYDELYDGLVVEVPTFEVEGDWPQRAEFVL